MPVNTVELNERQGRIWPSKPTVTASGVVSILQNSKPSIKKSNLDKNTNENVARANITDVVKPPVKLSFVQFNQRGDAMATGDARGNVALFRLTKNRYVQLKNLGCPITSMAFSPLRKNELACGTRDGTVYIFDIDSQRLLATLANAHKQAVTSISFHSSNAIMVTASVDGINIWDLKKWSKIKTLGAGSGIVSATFADRGTSLMVAFKDDTIVSWSTGSYAIQGKYDVPKTDRPFTIQTISLSPSGKLLIAGGKSRDMYMWNVQSKRLVSAIELPMTIGVVHKVHFMPDSRSVGVLGDDGRMLFLKVVAGENNNDARLDMEFARKKMAIVSFSMDENAKYCACCLSNGSVALYDIHVAKKFNDKVRDASLRMGATEEELDVNYPMYDPSDGKPVVPEVDPPSIVQVPAGPRPDFSAANKEEDEDESSAIAKATEEKQNNGIEVQPASTMESQILASSAALEMADEMEQPKQVDAQPSSAIINEAFGKNTADDRQALVAAKKKKILRKKKAQRQPRTVDQGKIFKRLSRPRLLALLRSYGQYPEKYRLLIWGYLLQLPRNEDAFAQLMRRGIHPNYANLAKDYPINNQRVMRKLQKLLSGLAHWSPVFSNLSYLPSMAFPFVKLFESEALGAFETIMAFVLNWCDGWFETFPHPPIPVLTHVERLLAHHDKPLLDNLVARGIDARVYAWRIMRTLFTEVLSRDEWLHLFDHILSHSDESSLFPIAIVAYLKQFRSAIIGAGSNEEIEAFLQRQNPVSMDGLIRSMYRLRANTPNELIPTKTEASAMNFPIGTGHYPIFDRYPKYVVNYQLQERQRIEDEEATIKKKRSNLQDLQRRAANLSRRESDWQIQQAEYLRSEEARVQKMASESQDRAKERQRLARLAEERRLEQVAFLQESAARALEYQKKAIEIQKQKTELEQKVRMEEQEQALKERAKEEELLSLEFQSMQQVQEIQAKRKTDDDMEALQAEYEAMQKQALLQHQRAMREMKLEDERRAALIKARTEELQKKAAELEVEKVRRELMTKQTVAEIEYEAKLAESDRERKLREARLEGQMSAEEEIEQKKRRQRILLEEEEREQKIMAMELKRWREEQQSKRAMLVDAAESRMQQEKEMREERLRQLESLQRKREFEEQIMHRKLDEGADIQEEEKKLQDILKNIDNERIEDRKAELELLFKEQELREKAAFNKVLRETDDRILMEERERFDRLRQHYRNVSSTADELAIRNHESRMKELVSQRQKEIMEHAAATRKSIRDAEISKLKEEFGEEDANAMIAKMDAQGAVVPSKKRSSRGNRRRGRNY